MKTRLALLPVLALTLSLAACSGTAATDEATTAAVQKTSVGGVVLVPVDAAASEAAEACVPTADFADIVDGAPVTITDEDGEALAESTIAAYTQQGDNCALTFFIDTVARDKGTYVVNIAGAEAATYSEEDLFAGGERRINLGE